MKENVHVGYTRKPFGVNGQLKLQIEPTYLSDALKAEVLFVEIDGQQVPYFIDNFNTTGDLVVLFEEVESREKAAKLVGRPIFLRPADILPLEEKAASIGSDTAPQYLNYQIEEKDLGPIGPIVRIEEFPQQEMGFVEYQGREVMIPLHPSFVVEEDRAKKVLVLALPEGILEIF